MYSFLTNSSLSKVSMLDYDFVINATKLLPSNQLHSHGILVAGVIAMEKDDNTCGVGVAYQSTITGREL